MSFKKTILAVAAVGALSAATAVPAMALENEFHGMYKAKYFVSNFDNSSAGYFTEAGTRATSPTAVNYFEQRARLFYSAKANDDLKLVVGFEMDAVFGDRSQGGMTNVNAPGNIGTNNTGTAFRNSGGALDTDSVNLETKWVHLDFNVPGVPMNVKVGTQPIKDSIKGILFDCDAAGIFTSTKMGAAKVNVGYFRGYEGNNGDVNGGGTAGGNGFKMGVNNLDIVILEGKFAVSKDFALGADYYGYYDYRSAAATMLLHTAALSADATMGPLALSGFVAGQLGVIRNQSGAASVLNNSTHSIDLKGMAANVAARLKAGPGTAKVAALYTSGDGGNDPNKNYSWQSLQQSVAGMGVKAVAAAPATTNLVTGVVTPAVAAVSASSYTNSGSLNTYNESGMMLLNRNAASQGGSSDRNIINTSNNRDQGVVLITAGYDANLTPKLYANANVGMGWTANNRLANNNDLTDLDAKRTSVRGSKYLGAEINVETGYKMYDNLTASVQAAYVILGGYYNNQNQVVGHANTDPDNPYTARVVLSYAF
jgi:hypothetical protein